MYTLKDYLSFQKVDKILLEKVKGKKIVQEKLPYKRTELAPVMSKNTLDYHYGKLHKAYVTNANKGEGDDFQIAGAFLHNLFFPQFKAPNSTNTPTGKIKELIEDKFASFDDFKTEVTDKAMDIQGSGWIYINKNCAISTIANHKIVNNIVLIIDWWEHAWALDYLSDKEKYLNNIWKIINWDVINKRI